MTFLNWGTIIGLGLLGWGCGEKPETLLAGKAEGNPLEGLVLSNQSHQHVRVIHEEKAVSADLISLHSWQFRVPREELETADGTYIYREDLIFADPILEVPRMIKQLLYHEGEYRVSWDQDQGIWIFDYKRVRGVRYDGNSKQMEPLDPRQELRFPISVWGDQVKISGTNYLVVTKVGLEKSIEDWRGQF